MSPQRAYRIKLAFDSFSVGQIIYPTGLWRGELLSKGFIEEHDPTKAEEPPPPPKPPTNEPPLATNVRRKRHMQQQPVDEPL